MPPTHIASEDILVDMMTRPTPALLNEITRIENPLVVLGAGGKMGPTLCKLARRAADQAGHQLDVIAVSRFTDKQVEAELQQDGIHTLRADLMDPAAYQQLPSSKNIIYLVGLKFGTANAPERTWAANTIVPALTMEHYKLSHVVALSTGNVYPLVSHASEGSMEQDALTPIGEYANACLARERIFSFYARRDQTPVSLVRLNYAIDMRYGVLVDLARRIWAGEAIDLSMGYFNCIWQGDANEMILRLFALADVPARAINITGTARLSVRETARKMGSLLGKEVQFHGTESATALLSDTSVMQQTLGEPATRVEDMIRWTAHWIRSGNTLWNKPTHFQIRDGQY